VGHGSWGLDPNPDLVTADFEHGDDDVGTDHDRLVRPAGEDKHVKPPKGREPDSRNRPG
jgi:hypothetical protein